MKIKLTITIILFSCFFIKSYGQLGDPPSVAQTTTPESLKAAERMLAAQHMDMQIVSIFNQVFNMARASVPADKKDKYINVAKTFIEKYAKWDAFKGKIIQMYAENYTIDELEQMTVFYKTPLGQKMANNQIEMGQQIVILVSQTIGEHKQELAEAFKQ
jgi:hypothetical protein